MTTPRVFEKVTGDDWRNVIGSAASVAGATWQNVGAHELMFSTTATKPGPTDAYFLLGSKEATYDKNGSAAFWVKASASRAETYISCMTD